ncbi:MAG: acetyl-CoA hydrolase/transferase C-terminal domain-containing protein [Pseudomonadota bacterium]
MLVDSLLELFKSDIIKRKVYEDLRLQKTLDENGFAEDRVEDIFRTLVVSKRLHSRIKVSEFAFLQHYGIFRKDLVYDRGQAVDKDQTWSLDMGDPKAMEAVIRCCLGDRLKNGVALYASFFIGPQKFYSDLREMDEDRLRLIDMRGVDYVNQLYGDEELKRAQRSHGRFINGGLMVHLTEAVTADCLEDHRLISGPGGQYNFVSMAHVLNT